MKKCAILVFLMLAVLALSVPSMAARQAALNNICHDPFTVFSAYCGGSEPNAVSQIINKGLFECNDDPVEAVPGVLSICPTDDECFPWANFVTAYQADVPYVIKNVVLKKYVPPTIQCTDIYQPKIVTQQGSNNIRTWWPLAYEVPGTTWVLTITYGTPSWEDPANPGVPSTVHQDVWIWRLETSIEDLDCTVDLFHEIPWGLTEVGLIGNECLFKQLECKLDALAVALNDYQLACAGDILADFEMEVAEAAITDFSLAPRCPTPVIGQGIANTYENPAACKLMVDAEALGFQTGAFQPSK